MTVMGCSSRESPITLGSIPWPTTTWTRVGSTTASMICMMPTPGLINRSGTGSIVATIAPTALSPRPQQQRSECYCAVHNRSAFIQLLHSGKSIAGGGQNIKSTNRCRRRMPRPVEAAHKTLSASALSQGRGRWAAQHAPFGMKFSTKCTDPNSSERWMSSSHSTSAHAAPTTTDSIICGHTPTHARKPHGRGQSAQ